MKLVRDAVSTARDKERRKKKVSLFFFPFQFATYERYPRIIDTVNFINTNDLMWIGHLYVSFNPFTPHIQGGPVLIPGFCLPKALQPVLPIFLQVLTAQRS